MHFSSTILTIAAVAGLANAQVRNVQAFFGDATNCNGNVLACDNIAPGTCCFSADLSGRFGSTRIANSQLDDVIAGSVPGGGDPQRQCGGPSTFGTGSQCVSDGPGGFTGVLWFVGNGAKKMKPRQAGFEDGVLTRKVVFHDGPVFDIDAMSEDVKSQLFDIAATGNSSTSVPTDLWKYEVRA